MELIYMHIVDVGRSIKAQGINFSNDFDSVSIIIQFKHKTS